MAVQLLAALSALAVTHRGHHVQTVINAASPPQKTNATTHFFGDAVLNHFGGVSDLSYWWQRFYVDQTYWCGERCPIFLYIGGEGPQGAPSDKLFMAHLAKQHGALMVALEHRFYGESFPTPDMSVSNLRFLSSHQALADLARFIAYVKAYSPGASDTKSSPPLKLKATAARSAWVSFGGSYPGALSAWLKLKYPASVAGAVSSSAPYHAESNFEQYAEVVGAALASPSIGGSPACFDSVKQAVAELRALVAATQPFGTHPSIPGALRPCAARPTPSSTLDLATYEANVFSGFQGTVQYNNEVPVVATVATLCTALTNATVSASPLERLAAVQSGAFGASCVPSSFAADQVAPLSNASFSARGCDLNCSSGRQWLWQSCNVRPRPTPSPGPRPLTTSPVACDRNATATHPPCDRRVTTVRPQEFGFWQTTTSSDPRNPFGAFVANDAAAAGDAICSALFGLSTPPQTEATNVEYGSRDLAAANVTVVNGGMDPWHALSAVDETDGFFGSCVGAGGGVLPPGTAACPAQRLTSSETVVTIPTTAHCGDMYAPDAFAKQPYCPGPSCHTDRADLVNAHERISATVARYVGAAPPTPPAPVELARRDRVSA